MGAPGETRNPVLSKCWIPARHDVPSGMTGWGKSFQFIHIIPAAEFTHVIPAEGFGKSIM